MTVWGWDLSHYDAPDSRHAVAEGFSFFTHKAGGDVDDAEIGQWWSLMKAYRGPDVLLGAYWIQYPDNPVGRADAFLARLDATCPGWRDGPFILQADCEIWGGNTATKPGLRDIETFCDRLVSKMPKLRPVVYAPPWAYHDELKGLSYPLWASRYVSGSGYASALYPGDLSGFWAAYSGQVPAILQFTSSANIAGQTTCDANAFRGTLAELTALVAPGWEVQMDWNDDIVPNDINPGTPGQPGYNPQMTVTWALRYASRAELVRQDIAAVKSQLAANQSALLAALQAVAAKDFVDENALVSAMAPAVAQAVVSLLPPGSSVTTDQMVEALKAFYGQVLSAQPAQAAATVPEPPDEVDTRTRQHREQAQRRIEGPGGQ